MLLSVDHGNFAIKTPQFSFISGLAEHTVRPPLADDIIEYKGRIWTPSGERIPYMRDKTRDDRFLILTLFAIAKQLDYAGISTSYVQIDLAVGLPPEHFGMLREKFSQYFKSEGNINFTFNGVQRSISIRHVFVYPQAYAAVVPYSQQMLETPRMFVVDVGGFTTDVLLLRYGKPDLQFCRSLEMGVIHMTNDVISKVGSLHDMLLDDDHITAVLQNKKNILPDEVKETIRTVVGQHATLILDKLRELQVDLRTNPVTFIGGGTMLFRTFFEASPLVAKADFIEDHKANAIGYEILAAAQLKKLSA